MENTERLSPQERELLKWFRSLEAEDRASAVHVVATMAKRSGLDGPPRSRVPFDMDDMG